MQISRDVRLLSALPSRRARLLAVMVAAAAIWPSPAQADLRAALAERQAALDKLYTEFRFQVRRAPIRTDPFDPANWEIPEWEGEAEARITAWVRRPAFRVILEGGKRGGLAGRSEHAWDGNKLTSKSRRDPERPWSVIISPMCFPAHGPYSYLTPLEMHFFEIEEPWYEWYQRGELAVTDETARQVVLAGGPLAREPMIPGWKLRVTLDPTRGYVPVEMSAKLDVPNEGTIEWTLRTIEACPIGKTWAIQEATMALRPVHPKTRDHWWIYHFVADVIRHQESMPDAQLAVALPESDYNLLDRTTGLIRRVDEAGTLLHEERSTPEALAAERREMQDAMERGIQAGEIKAERARGLIYVVAVAAVLTGLAAGGWLWRRRRLQAA